MYFTSPEWCLYTRDEREYLFNPIPSHSQWLIPIPIPNPKFSLVLWVNCMSWCSEAGWNWSVRPWRTSGSVLQWNVGNSLWWRLYWRVRHSRVQSARFRVCCCECPLVMTERRREQNVGKLGNYHQCLSLFTVHCSTSIRQSLHVTMNIDGNFIFHL